MMTYKQLYRAPKIPMDTKHIPQVFKPVKIGLVGLFSLFFEVKKERKIFDGGEI